MNLPDLPITAILDDLARTLRERGAVILVAPPGTGKTTVVPLALGGRVVVAEPRRIAARAAAARMASLLGEPVGETVGYSIRGERRVSARTRIEVVTSGLLVRRVQNDPELSGVDTVLLDECHERHLDADLLLALLTDARELRPDLQLLATSATVATDRLAQLLDAPVLTVEAPVFPTTTVYTPPVRNERIEAAVARATRLALSETDGDVLVFLPGAGEIARVRAMLDGVNVVTLHGRLSSATQDAALRRGSSQRVVLATAIAESSLTVPGVRAVVDSGLARVPRVDHRRGLPGLATVRVSAAVAAQRAGRAGREAPGRVYRCWPEYEHATLPRYPEPEIKVADLTRLALELACWGTPDGTGLRWWDAPPEGALRAGQTVLRALDAVIDGSPTDRGRRMAELGLHPRLARALLDGAPQVGARNAADVVAFLDNDSHTDDVDLDLALRKAIHTRTHTHTRGGARRDEGPRPGDPRNSRYRRGTTVSGGADSAGVDEGGADFEGTAASRGDEGGTGPGKAKGREERNATGSTEVDKSGRGSDRAGKDRADGGRASSRKADRGEEVNAAGSGSDGAGSATAERNSAEGNPAGTGKPGASSDTTDTDSPRGNAAGSGKPGTSSDTTDTDSARGNAAGSSKRGAGSGTAERGGAGGSGASRVDGGGGERWVREARRLAGLVGGNAGGAPDPALIVALAYPERLARRRAPGSAVYLMAGGTAVELPPGTGLNDQEWLAVAVADRRPGDAHGRIRLAAKADEALAKAIIPPSTVDEVVWDGDVTAKRVTRIGAITLSERPLANPSPESVEAAIRTGIHTEGIGILNWTDTAKSLRARMTLLHRTLGEPWPDPTDDTILSTVDLSAVRNRAQLGKVSVTNALKALLPWPEAARLDELTPERLEVPSGRKFPLDYTGDRPVLRIKLQEAFGWTRTPLIVNGQVRVQLHLLSPAGRPAAVTDDLESFWVNGYPQVRAELRGRYPKHDWPATPQSPRRTPR